jgi:RNA polymerase sigma-70 factor (ECF subfamily)
VPPKPRTDPNSDPLRAKIEDTINLLYEKHAAALLRYGQAICGDLEIARDAVQEAFLRYYIALREGTTTGEARGWLYSTTRNYILDRLKEHFVQNGESLNAASRLAEDADDPEGQILRGELEATAHSLLTPREFACLRLRSEGLKYREIGRTLKIETATVGVLLGRALRKIRAAVNERENGE